ncbi:hypothetical protein Purlil1_13959 [Purpureocillium lilacinum]|uniref:RRM domain-containing protein n=1 Tax=Purpureocillium lilacinum TaxID=33203 RepID=A0ABR0BCL4_PURLI|nr:hypothetical protein Purlil1_13959 [Purpureocillium lilacinum]
MATTAADDKAVGGDQCTYRCKCDNQSASARCDCENGGYHRSGSPSINVYDGHNTSAGHRNDNNDGAAECSSDLFFHGIHPRLTETEVSKMFKRYGDVESCRILHHSGTRVSRGFGFIRMATPKQAEAAQEGLHGIEVEGRTLTVKKARALQTKRDCHPRLVDSYRPGRRRSYRCGCLAR